MQPVNLFRLFRLRRPERHKPLIFCPVINRLF
jgi:hypothetical protein